MFVVQETIEPEVQDVICSVCEEAYSAHRLEEHSELCAVLLQVGRGRGKAIYSHSLTKLAEVLHIVMG